MKDSKEIKFILELFNSNKLIEAKKEINKQIKKNQKSSILLNILGAVYASENQINKAIENYEEAIKIDPNYAQAYNNLGTAFHKQNKVDEAILSYKKAIHLKNDFAEAYNNLGNAFRELDKPKEALKYFEKALTLKKDYAEAWNNMGAAYESLKDKNKALDNYKRAIEIKPDYAEAHNNLGMLLSELGRFDDSFSHYNQAIKIKPEYEKTYNNLGNLLNNIGKYDEATNAYKKAIKIKPNYAKAFSNLLFNLNYKTDFDPSLYLAEAKKFGLNCKPIKSSSYLQYNYEKKPKKLRLGLVSADFGNHPGGYFTLSTLKELRNKDFDLIAYSTTNRQDEFSPHFRPLFVKWNLIEKQQDEEVAKEIIKDGIHILMDLQGHSANNRLPIFMYKAAPIQASWLGQGSTGISEIDYFIGSPHITPKNEEKYYTEKILRLPQISQCFTPPNFDVKINNLPALENNFITFGCVNKLSKVNDEVINLWSKILLSVENSKLIIKNKNLENKKIFSNMIEKFNERNVKKNRLILLGESNTRKELLEAYNKIDIALDPFPFQGNTSTCESIWMGVPVITLKGDRYLSHFGESINSNLNMNNWIAKNYKEYISIAIKFSSDLNELSKIRMNLRKKALQSPVFDASLFASHFSDMLWSIWNDFSKKK